MVTIEKNSKKMNQPDLNYADSALHDKDTGSVEMQVATLTFKINELSEHFKNNPKDFSSRRGLLGMISRRKKFLSYLKDRKKETYTKLLSDLNLRR